jgi:hypothetical protein
MRSVVLVYCTLLLYFGVINAQIIATDQQQLFYFFNNVPLSITFSVSPTLTTLVSAQCICVGNPDPDAFVSCSVSSDTAGDQLTYTLQAATGHGGYCNGLVFQYNSQNLSTPPVAFIENMYVTPIARPAFNATYMNLTITTQPTMTQAQFVDVIHQGSSLVSTLVPNVVLNTLAPSIAVYYLAYAQNLKLTSVSPLLDNQYYMIDWGIMDNVAKISLPTTQPLLLYNAPVVVSVTPTLSRVNYPALFTLSTNPNTVGSDFATSTGISLVETDGISQPGVIVTSKMLQVTTSVLNIGNNTFSVSLDGQNYNTQSPNSIPVEGFDFPSNMTVNYTLTADHLDTTDPGCSIFGLNEVNFYAYNLVQNAYNREAIFMQIIDAGFSRTVSCSWIPSANGIDVDGISCPCPQLWDLNVALPQDFQFAIQLNGNDWYNSLTMNLVSGIPVIHYYNPTSFITTPAGKLWNDNATFVQISQFANRYDGSEFVYSVLVLGQQTGALLPLANVSSLDSVNGPVAGCISDGASGFQCNVSFFNFALNDSRTLSLCGCNYYEVYNYDNPFVPVVVNCTETPMNPSCPTVNITTTPTPTPTPTPAVNNTQCAPDYVCNAAFVTSVNRQVNPLATPIDYVESVPFYIYGPLNLGNPATVPFGITPKNIALGQTYTLTINVLNGVFINTGVIQYMLTPISNDPYAQNMTSTGNSANATVLYGPITYISPKQATFTVTAFKFEAAMNISISMNNGTSYDRLSGQVVRFYDPSRFVFTKVIGDKGNNSTLPKVDTIVILGDNFFPSDSITIQYTLQSITLASNCTFISSVQLNCSTPDMLSTGVNLPSTFNISIQFDSGPTSINPFISTGLAIIFEDSTVPVIVQVVPQMGPINTQSFAPGIRLDGSYYITVKGITNSAATCQFQYWNGSTPIGYPISGNLQGNTGEEVQCQVKAPQILSSFGVAGVYRLYLVTSLSQPSDPFDFTFYFNPNLTDIEPRDVAAYGGDTVTIYGTGFPVSEAESIYNIGLLIGDTQSQQYCNVLNSTAITCTTPPHPDGQGLAVSVTFNQNQYATLQGVNFNVDACSVGYYAQDFTQQCQPCPIGTYKPLSGFFDCIQCEIGRYQNLPAQQLCNNCPRFTTTQSVQSINITQCDCAPGYFRGNNTTPGINCNICPSGGNCTGGSALPQPLPGYWYNAADSSPNGVNAVFIFSSCAPHADWCTGILSINDGCIIGHTGILCSSCSDGWYSSGSSCLQCTDDVRYRFIIVVVIIIVLVIIFFKFAQLKVAYLSSVSIAVSYFQVIAIFSAYDFKWPPALQNALQTLNFINLNIDIIVPECISIITYGLKWGITVALPAIFLVCLILLWTLELFRSIVVVWISPIIKPYIMNWYRIDKRNLLTKWCTEQRRDIADFICTPRSGPELKEFADKCIHTFMIIISFSYIFVLTKASEIFNCIYIPESNQTLMEADTTVTCYQGVWWAYFPFSIGLIILFGLGTLVLFLYISLNRKRISKDKVFNDRFRFLFVRFRNERLFWEAIIVLRKLLISTCVIFFAGYPMLVILFCMFVIFCSFILQTHHVPFRRVFHNIMEYVQLLSTEFLLFAALLFYVNAFPDSSNANALGYVTITVVVLCTFVMACLILLDIMSQVRRDWKIHYERKYKNAVVVNTVYANEDGDVELKEVSLKDNTATVPVYDTLDLESPTSPQKEPASPLSPTDSVSGLTSPASSKALLRQPSVNQRPQVSYTPAFVLKVQQKLPKPHPKVAKVTSAVWSKFIKFLDSIEGDDFDTNWEKVKEETLAEEDKKAKEEAERLEQEKQEQQEQIESQGATIEFNQSSDIELPIVQIPQSTEEEIKIDEDNQFHNM